MSNNNFKEILNGIKTSDPYGKAANWEKRGLNPSDESVILILNKATNDFLCHLGSIVKSDDSSEKKRKQISDLVDQLPWDELDTEEKEFMADTLGPAIEAAGFDPWSIF